MFRYLQPRQPREVTCHDARDGEPVNPRFASVLIIGVVGCLMTMPGCGGSSAPKRDAADVQVLQGTTPQASSAGAVGNYKPTGTIIVDTGFRPPADGFAFENYGTGAAVKNLTPAAVEGLFGSEVCTSGTGNTCLLIPPARAWMEEENDALAAGHCFGMALSASRFYGRQLYPEGFGGASPAQLALTGNAALQRTIAQGSALQELPAIRQKAIPGTPNDILDALIKGMRAHKPLYVLGLFRTDGGGGHAITPYAVEDRGDGRFAVLVYDNNYPASPGCLVDRRQRVEVHRPVPRRPQRLRRRGRRRVWRVTPKGLVPCPFCNGKNRSTSEAGSQQFNEIALEGDATNHAHVLVTDAKGRRTGYVNRRIVNEIPGAQVLRRLSNKTWKEDAEPVYLIPANRPISVLVNGAEIRRPVVERLEFIGPGDRVAAEGIALRRGESVKLHFAGDGSRVSLRTDPAHNESPVLRVGIEDAPDSYDFALKAKRMTGGSKLTVRLDKPNYQFDIDTRGVKKAKATTYDVRFGRYDLKFERMTPSGTMTFRHPNLLIPAGTVAKLDYKEFSDQQRTLDLELQQGGKTKIEKLRG